jgi:SRSO17 transposase
MNDIPLINQLKSIKVNYIELKETVKLSKDQIIRLKKKVSVGSKNKTYNDFIKESTFAYITNITPTKLNIRELIQCGRTRWRIENGFNSLKKRGYHFEHNFGHGKETLSSVLATLLLLAFLINSISKLNDDLLIKVQEKFNSFNSFTTDMAVLTKYYIYNSIHELLLFMYEKLYEQKYEDSS